MKHQSPKQSSFNAPSASVTRTAIPLPEGWGDFVAQNDLPRGRPAGKGWLTIAEYGRPESSTRRIFLEKVAAGEMDMEIRIYNGRRTRFFRPATLRTRKP